MLDSTAPIDASGLRVGLVASGYHRDVTDPLVAGARDLFLRSGGTQENLIELEAPGTFELPVLAQALARREDVDGVVAIGCVITGETRHDEYISAAVADGLMRLSLDTAKPVAFGVLTCPDLEHARARAGGAKGNKGTESMAAVVRAALAGRSVAGGTP